MKSLPALTGDTITAGSTKTIAVFRKGVGQEEGAACFPICWKRYRLCPHHFQNCSIERTGHCALATIRPTPKKPASPGSDASSSSTINAIHPATLAAPEVLAFLNATPDTAERS